MKRVVIVYNPRSSKAKRVEEEVIAAARVAKGLMVGKYGVLPTDVDDNAKRLSRVLADGDVVVSAGGDGTATIALNGVMLSGKKVKLSVLPYGNFNDLARSFRGQEGKMWYPLEVFIDGEHWRYIGAYFSMGMMAESTEVFDGKKERKKLREKGGGIVYSIRKLTGWYFKNRKREFIPEGKLDGEDFRKGTTDYLAVNGVSVARVMKNRRYGFLSKTFFSVTGRFRSIFRLIPFMMKSMRGKMPGERTQRDMIEFSEPATVEVQAEGEYRKLKGVQKIIVRKATRGVEITEKVW